MEIVETKDYEEMSILAAEKVIDRVLKQPQITLALPTGHTPVGLYKRLVEDHRKNETPYQDVITFNLDEYTDLSPDHPNSYHYYMNHHFFQHIDIQEKHAHLPDGTARNLDLECERYEELILKHGGVDLQILGIGQNGHIGFNEPGTPLNSRTHVVKLSESTRKANSRYFHSLQDVPYHAITMGLATIMNSKKILLLASGAHKSATMFRFFHEAVTPDFPATILKHHPNVTVIADRPALKEANVTRGM